MVSAYFCDEKVIQPKDVKNRSREAKEKEEKNKVPIR